MASFSWRANIGVHVEIEVFGVRARLRILRCVIYSVATIREYDIRRARLEKDEGNRELLDLDLDAAHDRPARISWIGWHPDDGVKSYKYVKIVGYLRELLDIATAEPRSKIIYDAREDFERMELAARPRINLAISAKLPSDITITTDK